MVPVRSVANAIAALLVISSTGNALAQSPRESFRQFGPASDELIAGATTTWNTNILVPATGNSIRYEFDLATGIPKRTSDGLGAVFTSRASTVGKGTLAVGFSAIDLSFDEIDGVDLGNGELLLPLDTPFGPTVGTAAFEADALVMQLSATYGLTESLDVSMTIPVIDADVEAVLTTQIGPTTVTNAQSFSKTALADIAMQAKWKAFERQNVAAALALTVFAPTGDKDYFIGIEAWRFQPSLVTTVREGPLAGHLNLGLDVGESNDLPNAFIYKAAVDYSVLPKLTVFGEILGRHSFDNDRLDLSTLLTTQADADDNISDAVVGLKANPAADIVLSATAIFALNDAGERDEFSMLFAIESSF